MRTLLIRATSENDATPLPRTHIFHNALSPLILSLQKKRQKGLLTFFILAVSLYRIIASIPLVVYKQTGVWTEVLSGLELRWGGKDNLDNSPFNYLHISIFKLHSLNSVPWCWC